ncbi:MAG: hypothetical protein LBJ58_04545 [Tannerellaceae bacterium]|nr:hypothetical protein [Tannerellaceae bacterium]
MIFIAAGLFPAAIRAQVVTQTEAEAIEGKIRVTCLLETPFYIDLFLSYSDDDGASFHPCLTVSGDLVNQLSGLKELIWDCGKDGIIMGSFIFRVTSATAANPPWETVDADTTVSKPAATANPVRTEEKKPEAQADLPIEKPRREPAVVAERQRPTPKPSSAAKTIFIMPGASIGPVISYSLMVGYTGEKWGGYLKAKSNFASKEGDGRMYGSDELFYENGYYNGGRMGVSAGVVRWFGAYVGLYAGVEYGSRWIEWKTIDGAPVGIEDYSYTVIEPEVGLLFRFRKLSFGAGGNMLPGGSAEFAVSIGINF